MGRAKDIIVKPISSKDGNRIVKTLHYSGKVVQNSQVHLGVFLDGRCGGALQFGPSLDKRKMLGLVEGTGWNEFIELNRMALADWLPRNGESRAIGYAMRWLRKTYPFLKWVISFADGTQCGDGTIYRASGFVLTGIKKNSDLFMLPDGRIEHSMNAKAARPGRLQREINPTGVSSNKAFKNAGAKKLVGFQLRYIYFLDPGARARLTVPEIPFEEIGKRGASMYLGEKRAGSVVAAHPPSQEGRGGSNPTSALDINPPPEVE